MQHARCLVRINGDIGNIAAKAPVTPAEVVMLRAIHGPDAVSAVALINGGVNDKTSHAEELARLKATYTAQNEDGKPIIDSVFPGHSPTLPTTFDEIGIAINGDEPRTAKGKKAAAKNKAAAKAEEDAGEVGGDVDGEETDPESED